jgi:hypothetical protein
MKPFNAIATGVIGGFVGTAAMATFEAVWSSAVASSASDPALRAEARTRLANAGVGEGHWPQGEPRSHQRPLSASEEAADALSRAVTGRTLRPASREKVGSLFHFAFGAAAGAVYGALSTTRAKPLVQAGRGTLYGAAVWLLADELAMPLTGFGDPPHRTPLRRHAYVLGAHLAYGFGLHAAARFARSYR